MTDSKLEIYIISCASSLPGPPLSNKLILNSCNLSVTVSIIVSDLFKSLLNALILNLRN